MGVGRSVATVTPLSAPRGRTEARDQQLGHVHDRDRGDGREHDRHPVLGGKRNGLEDLLGAGQVDDEAVASSSPRGSSTSHLFLSDSSEKTVPVSLRKLKACRSCVSTSAEKSIVRDSACVAPSAGAIT